jgi:hypothetical protein
MSFKRKRRNRIKRLLSEEGSWVEEKNLASYVETQYKSLFQSQGVNRLDDIMNSVQRRVSPAMNIKLMAAYTEDEVDKALNAIGDLKAPGSDAMSAFFSKNSGPKLENVLRMRCCKFLMEAQCRRVGTILMWC